MPLIHISSPSVCMPDLWKANYSEESGQWPAKEVLTETYSFSLCSVGVDLIKTRLCITTIIVTAVTTWALWICSNPHLPSTHRLLWTRYHGSPASSRFLSTFENAVLYMAWAQGTPQGTMSIRSWHSSAFFLLFQLSWCHFLTFLAVQLFAVQWGITS